MLGIREIIKTMQGVAYRLEQFGLRRAAEVFAHEAVQKGLLSLAQVEIIETLASPYGLLGRAVLEQMKLAGA